MILFHRFLYKIQLYSQKIQIIVDQKVKKWYNFYSISPFIPFPGVIEFNKEKEKIYVQVP